MTATTSTPVSGRRPIEGPAVWTPATLGPGASWRHDLTADERGAIVEATHRALAQGATVDTVGPEHFVLDDLGERLAAWSDELEHGRAFLLLRGFPVDLLDQQEREIAYVGFGSHFGRPVGQNAAADRLTHIRDERLPITGRKVRLYRTRERQDFHSDGADVIGLLCLHRARSGGESRIVSSGTIYNEILRRRPDLLEVLYAPMAWDRQDEHAPGERPWFALAPINDVGGLPRVFYIGWYIRDAQRHADVARLTPQQLEAMELLESIANDPAFHLEMDFEPGDIQLLNNGKILHAREAYEDDEDPSQRRHLLRLWLAAHAFVGVEPGLRTGVGQRR